MLKPGHYAKIFGISGLPKVEKPLVLYTGSGVGKLLENAEQHMVATIHGKVKLMTGTLKGVPDLPVVVVLRHSDAVRDTIGHHTLPHSIKYEAYAVAVAALDPVAVVTMHAIGVANTHKSYAPGKPSIISDFMPTGQNSKTIYSRKAQKALVDAGYSLPQVAHTPLPPERLADKQLAKIVATAAKKAKLPLAKEVICHTIPGPAYETRTQVKFLVSNGITGFSMTHENDVRTLLEALQAAAQSSFHWESSRISRKE